LRTVTIGKSILGEMRLCSRSREKFSDRVLAKIRRTGAVQRKRRVMATELVFRTSPSFVNIPAGGLITLATVSVANFDQIRVVASVTLGSHSPVVFILVFIEGANESVAPLDTLVLTPGANVTRVYAVPGRTLKILGLVNDLEKSSAAQVLVYA
jgi:hypothetical protein